ncbi:MAG: biotin--[acetyl-CoA-carboxylase] ligase [Spirochaetaceae bacterium]|jgi:BirA family biotin operon repressor/biotin-[acetyl-CoA-carboxylase] ligase|nr:biotin--[acetyl-CoA-carboxylase] ligase [Spirochaetaceae bacterium]
MVNDTTLHIPSGDRKLSTKAWILKSLREQTQAPLSGETMAAELHISRVAVWKAVQSLRTAGYRIAGDDKGYILEQQEEPEDFLYPWEFGEREKSFFHWDSTDSTMNRARDLAERGITAAVAVAETQTKGRGRSGRGWYSDRGGLFFTLLSRPSLAAADYTIISMAVQTAVCKALSELTGMKAELHWPNDVYIEGRKIAGILTEFHAEGDRITWISSGIGVNINNTLPGNRFASCGTLNGKPVSRREALTAILDQAEAIQMEHKRELHRHWNNLAYGRGRPVVIIPPGHDDAGKTPSLDTIMGRGRFMGIDSRGRGVIESQGELKRFSPGSASFLFQDEM